MVDQVGICNLALSWLGAKQITSIGDPQVEAVICKANYDSARDAVLEDRDWTFAVVRRKLTPINETPEFGFPFAFLIPPSALRIITVTDGAGRTASGRGRDVNWQLEGQHILTDREVIYVRWVDSVKPEIQFSSGFVQAFAARLAADMTMPLTHSKTLQADMWQLYASKLAIAAANDGRQGRSEKITPSELDTSRRLGSGIL